MTKEDLKDLLNSMTDKEIIKMIKILENIETISKIRRKIEEIEND